MKNQTYDKISGTGRDENDRSRTTTYEDVVISVPESPEELVGLSEMSWDELAMWAFAYKRYLQYQSCARRGLSVDEADAFVEANPIATRAEASIATKVRKAQKDGKLTAEQRAKIAAVLNELD